MAYVPKNLRNTKGPITPQIPLPFGGVFDPSILVTPTAARQAATLGTYLNDNFRTAPQPDWMKKQQTSSKKASTKSKANDPYAGYHGKEGKQALLKQLQSLGYLDDWKSGYVENAKYHMNKAAGEAVKAFQKDMGLAQDGIAGPKTLNALRNILGGAKSDVDPNVGAKVGSAGKAMIPWREGFGNNQQYKPDLPNHLQPGPSQLNFNVTDTDGLVNAQTNEDALYYPAIQLQAAILSDVLLRGMGKGLMKPLMKGLPAGPKMKALPPAGGSSYRGLPSPKPGSGSTGKPVTMDKVYVSGTTAQPVRSGMSVDKAYTSPTVEVAAPDGSIMTLPNMETILALQRANKSTAWEVQAAQKAFERLQNSGAIKRKTGGKIKYKTGGKLKY